MNQKHFSTQEALRFGWETMKNNFTFLAGLTLLVGFFSIGPDTYYKLLTGIPLTDPIPDRLEAFILPLSLLFFGIGIMLSIGKINIALKFVKHKKTGYSDLLERKQCYWKFLGASVLYGLIMLSCFLGGLITIMIVSIGFSIPLQSSQAMVIFPIAIIAIGFMIMLALKYQFYSYLIVDKNLGAQESLKESAQMTQGIKWDLLLFGMTLGLVNVLGFLAFGIGLLVTLPTTLLANAFVYSHLTRGHHHHKEQ
jgi:hypothetical protein